MLAEAATWDGLDVIVLSPTPTYPLDAGNRRRVFHLTRSLRELGARIVFVHYPSEGEWRDGVPAGAVAAMSTQWDENFTIPVTRPLHMDAEAADHLADEWWDPAIGHMLDWLFRTHSVDVLIVNYTWLTRAFEHCPRGVLRVLDTHDRFSGRRELLASAGIGAEFFHTTEDEERKALGRADVIWSIKPQEADFFLSLGMRHVVNMPYFEPVDPPPASRVTGGILRFGLVGAANSVNLVNVNAFLAAIRAYVERTLLPCEIVIAGSICDLLPPPGVSWIHVLGRLPDLAAFYEGVDVVVAPMSISTGLKIKVGEALCHGKAVVALAHAFEGYPARHPFHTLPSLDDMTAACRQIVNRPALVRELEVLSAAVVRDIRSELGRGFARTIAELGRMPPSLCIVLPLRDVFEGSMVLDHVLEAAEYLGHVAEVSVFVDGDADADWAAAPFGLLARVRRLVLARHPARAETGCRLRKLGLNRPSWASLAELMRTRQIGFWFVSCCRGWIAPEVPARTRAYFNADVAALGADVAGGHRMLALLKASFREVVTISRRDLDPAFAGTPDTWSHRVPCFWHGDHSRALARLRHEHGDSIAILADSADDPLLGLTVAMVSRLSPRRVEVVLAERAGRCFAADGIAPGLVIDIASDAAFECAREVIDRSGVPCVTLFSDRAVLDQPSRHRFGIASGVLESAELLGRVLTSAGAASALVAERAHAGNYRHDAGWTLLWTEVEALSRLSALEADSAGEFRGGSGAF